MGMPGRLELRLVVDENTSEASRLEPTCGKGALAMPKLEIVVGNRAKGTPKSELVGDADAPGTSR